MSWRNEGSSVPELNAAGTSVNDPIEDWHKWTIAGSGAGGGDFISEPELERQYALRHNYLAWRDQFRTFVPCTKKEREILEWVFYHEKYDAPSVVGLLAEWLAYQAAKQESSWFTMELRYDASIVAQARKWGLSNEEIVDGCLAYLRQGETQRQAQRAVFKERYDAL